jgi:hypothetical protein
MNILFTLLGLGMIITSTEGKGQTIGAIVAGAGLNGVLRENEQNNTSTQITKGTKWKNFSQA